MSVPGGQQYRGHTPQPHYNGDVNAPSLHMPDGYMAYSNTMANGHTLVNVQNGVDTITSAAQMYQARQMLPMMPQYQYSMPQQMNFMPQMQFPRVMHAPPQQQQPPPPPKPAVVRKKNLLKFVNPDTNEAVFPDPVEVSAAPVVVAEVAVKAESPPPQVPAAAISEASRTSSDDIRHQFTTMVIKQFQKTANQDILDIPEKATDDEPLVSKTDHVPKEITPVFIPKEKTPVADRSMSVEQPETPPVPTSREVSETPANSESDAPPKIVVDPVVNEAIGGDDADKQSSKTPPCEDKAVVLEEYEQSVTDYFGDTEKIALIASRVYPRDLVELLRKIIKKFGTVACPLTEEQLRSFLIDRTTMPPVANVAVNRSKYQAGRIDSFNPSWNLNNKPVRYQGRYSDNKQKKPQQSQTRAPVVARQSIQRTRAPKLERGKDAWVPATVVQKPEDNVDHVEKVKKEIRGLLNKVTPSTYADLSTEFINKKVWKDKETLPTVVELIFTKAVEEPTFVGIYSDLCKVQHEAERKQNNDSREFYQAVVRKCQAIFEGTVETPAKVQMKKIEDQLLEEEDAKKKVALKEDLEDLRGKEKRYMLGTIKFISHLYRIKFLNWKVINFCIIRLLKTAESSSNDLDIEYCINLLETVGSFMETKTELNACVDFVSQFKSKVPSRVKFMILGLEDLRNKNWAQKNEGPKTKEEVKTEVAKEEAQNKRDRDTYDRDRKTPYNGRSSGQNLYVGHASKDKTERKTNAVVNSSNAGSGKDFCSRKDVKLDKLDTNSLKPFKPTKKGVANEDGWKNV